MSTVILVGMMFLVFWLLVWRPQAKEQEKLEKFTRSLMVGSEVVTASGILGKIVEVEDKVVTLQLSKNTKMRVLRSQIHKTQEEALSDLKDPKAKKSEEEAAAVVVVDDSEEDSKKQSDAW